MRARVDVGARVGRQPRRGREHDRRQQHDRRVEAQYRGRCRRPRRTPSPAAAAACRAPGGHRRAQRLEQPGPPAPVGEQQQRRQEPDGRAQVAHRRPRPAEADRAGREHHAAASTATAQSGAHRGRVTAATRQAASATSATASFTAPSPGRASRQSCPCASNRLTAGARPRPQRPAHHLPAGIVLDRRRAGPRGVRHGRARTDVRRVGVPRATIGRTRRGCSCTEAAARAPTT